MTLHIYYRHASSKVLGLKSRPSWFSYRRCFQNIAQSTKGEMQLGHVVLNVIFDGTEDDFRADEISGVFNELVSDDSIAVRPALEFITGGDQRKAWRKGLEVVLSDIRQGRVANTDWVYLLENDYVHVDNWFAKFQELSASGVRCDYLTLYDHPDKYPDLTSVPDAGRYRRLVSQVFCTGTQHWRSTPSTCATYVVPVQVLIKDRLLLGLGIYDYKLFKILTLLRRRKLLSPIPSLSTHAMDSFLAPVVDWEDQLK